MASVTCNHAVAMALNAEDMTMHLELLAIGEYFAYLIKCIEWRQGFKKLM
jgi:hypothetical protein